MTPLVVTRFSIRGFGREVPTRDWMRERFELLQRVGLPGLTSTDRNVVWTLLADPETVDFVSTLVTELPSTGLGERLAIHVVPAAGGDMNLGVGVEPLADLPVEDSGTMTFRLDSDDGFLPGTIDRVMQLGASAQLHTVINLADGYQLTLNDERLRRLSIPLPRQGPFLAIRRPIEKMFDVGGDHREARRDVPVLHMRGRSWVQTVHGGNVSNDRVDPSWGQLRHVGDRRLLLSGTPVVGRRIEQLLR